MKIAFDQLSVQLKKKFSSIYLVAGDEPLLSQEACAQINDFAKKQGFSERHAYTVTHNFDWARLQESTSNLSLFSDKKLIELNLGNAKLGQTGGKQLKQLIENNTSDICLLLIADKLDTSQQNSSWCKAAIQQGVYVQIWPIQFHQLPAWIQQRAKQLALDLNSEATHLIAQMTEGNLLAAKQAIDLLSLSVDAGHPITTTQVKTILADDSRYNVFECVDQLLQSNLTKVRHILTRLEQEEHGAIPLLVWAIARELRQLITMAEQIDSGATIQQALNQFKIWPKRKPIIQHALTQQNLSNLHYLLMDLSEIELICKGAQSGNAWQALHLFCINWCTQKRMFVLI